MSREIKFRGIHNHVLPQNEHLNGTWIYGYWADENYINSPELEGEFLVDKDTVGQHIGVKDKNAKEVYESDIVRQYADCTESGKSLYYFYVIEWSEEYCAFVGRDIHSNETYLMPDLEDIEIIGNMYENSDLLKEESGNE